MRHDRNWILLLFEDRENRILFKTFSFTTIKELSLVLNEKEQTCSNFGAKSLWLLRFQQIAMVFRPLEFELTSKSKPLKLLASSLMALKALPEQMR